MKQTELRKLKVGEQFYMPGKQGYLLETFKVQNKKEGMLTVFSEISGQMYFLSGEIIVLIKKEETKNEIQEK